MKLISFVFLAVCVFYAKADFKIGLSNQGVPELSTRLIGAKDAKKGQFPYQVGLRKKFIHFQFCGASLINSRYLLTAAHCIVDTFAEEIYAAIGALYRTKQGHVRDGVDVDIEKLIPHLEYDSDAFDIDIGLIRTAKEIIFTKFIQPVALATRKTEIADVVISGFGHNKRPYEDKWDNVLDILQYLETKTITNEACKKQHKEHEKYVRDTDICTFLGRGYGTCYGDSGGPVVEVVNGTKELIGIVSSAIGCAEGYGDDATRVFSYIDWIEEQIAEQN